MQSFYICWIVPALAGRGFCTALAFGAEPEKPATGRVADRMTAPGLRARRNVYLHLQLGGRIGRENPATIAHPSALTSPRNRLSTLNKVRREQMEFATTPICRPRQSAQSTLREPKHATFRILAFHAPKRQYRSSR